MIKPILLRTIVIAVLLVFMVGSWITTGAPNTSLLSFFSAAVFVCTLVLFAWDRWLWKLRLIQATTGVTRDLSGTWEATLESLWIDPATGTKPEPKTVYVVIRQTSSRATVTLISDESKSKSSIARVIKEDDSWLLHYVYSNEPRLELRARSPIHHGSGVLSAVGNPVERISGGYWTDRDSKGSLRLKRRSRHLIEDFEGGQSLFGGS
jgi:hypothetical protein